MTAWYIMLYDIVVQNLSRLFKNNPSTKIIIRGDPKQNMKNNVKVNIVTCCRKIPQTCCRKIPQTCCRKIPQTQSAVPWQPLTKMRAHTHTQKKYIQDVTIKIPQVKSFYDIKPNIKIIYSFIKHD